MKRFFTMLLAAAMLLSFVSCGNAAQKPDVQETEPDTVQVDPLAAQYLNDFALISAELPTLPAMPSDEELMEQFNKLEYDKMGAEAYDKAQQAIWGDWDARSRAYADAVKALRGDGVERRLLTVFSVIRAIPPCSSLRRTAARM